MPAGIEPHADGIIRFQGGGDHRDRDGILMCCARRESNAHAYGHPG